MSFLSDVQAAKKEKLCMVYLGARLNITYVAGAAFMYVYARVLRLELYVFTVHPDLCVRVLLLRVIHSLVLMKVNEKDPSSSYGLSCPQLLFSLSYLTLQCCRPWR